MVTQYQRVASKPFAVSLDKAKSSFISTLPVTFASSLSSTLLLGILGQHQKSIMHYYRTLSETPVASSMIGIKIDEYLTNLRFPENYKNHQPVNFILAN